MRQLIFIHGRSQEHKDSKALKQEWLDALNEGLAKSGLRLPLGDADIRFPYYGDTLFDLVAGRSASEAAAVVVRGTEADQDEIALRARRARRSAAARRNHRRANGRSCRRPTSSSVVQRTGNGCKACCAR